MTHDVISSSVANQATFEIGARDVCPLRVQWVDICTIELVGQEGQGVGIKAILSRNFTMRDGTCLEGKVPHVMSRKHTLEGNVSSGLVATLGNSRHDAANAVWGQVIVMITDKATAGFSSTNVETMRTGFHSRVGFGSTRPLSCNFCVVVT